MTVTRRVTGHWRDAAGDRSVAYNAPYVVPDSVSPFDYAAGNVTFSSEVT